MTSTNLKPFLSLLASIAAFVIAFMTMQGTLQKHIYFADPLNEMFFCVAALMIGFIYLYLGIAGIYDLIKKK